MIFSYVFHPSKYVEGKVSYSTQVTTEIVKSSSSASCAPFVKRSIRAPLTQTIGHCACLTTPRGPTGTRFFTFCYDPRALIKLAALLSSFCPLIGDFKEDFELQTNWSLTTPLRIRFLRTNPPQRCGFFYRPYGVENSSSATM